MIPANRLFQTTSTPAWHESAWDRGETRCLVVDVSPGAIGGVSVFYLPYRPGLRGLRRALKIARALARGVHCNGGNP